MRYEEAEMQWGYAPTPAPTEFMQQIIGTLAHHINTPLMAALLELDTLRHNATFDENTQTRAALHRLTVSLLQIDHVIRAAQQVESVRLIDYVGCVQILDLQLHRTSSYVNPAEVAGLLAELEK